MQIRTRKNTPSLRSGLLGLAGIMLICGLFGCEGSSSTKSAAKDATSGEFQINAQILTPASGSTIVFVSGGTNVTATATATGGTGTYGFNWNVQGSTTSSSASGQNATLLFQEVGPHTISLVVKDSNGITDSDSVNVNVTVSSGGGTTPTTTTSTTTTSTTTTTTTTSTTTTT